MQQYKITYLIFKQPFVVINGKFSSAINVLNNKLITGAKIMHVI